MQKKSFVLKLETWEFRKPGDVRIRLLSVAKMSKINKQGDDYQSPESNGSFFDLEKVNDSALKFHANSNICSKVTSKTLDLC